jgi:hypothetical protein
LVVVLTYKDALQEDFDSGIPSIENFYLQTGNRKEKTTNRKVNMALKPIRQWGTTEAQFQSWLQNPKRANCNKRNMQTRETTRCKQQTSEQAQRGPSAAIGLQLCKVESNNNKQRPPNQRASINQ